MTNQGTVASVGLIVLNLDIYAFYTFYKVTQSLALIHTPHLLSVVCRTLHCAQSIADSNN